jgi:hypothetical protein
MKKIIIIFVFIFMFVSPAFGLTKYGDATIKKGHLIVLRGGQNLKFSDSGRTYLILNKDVLKVGDDSLVILKTVEDAIVRMGSNAVFQVRPWKQKKKHGFLRMLYGKAIFKVRKFFVKKKRFNFKTATAVAGVRGTKWKEQTTSTGAGETEGIEEIVVITPAGRNFEIHVKPGERSLTLNTVKITKPIKVPVEERVREEEPEIVLTSLPPTSKESVKIENKEFYIINNIVTVDEFKESESEIVDINENFDKLEEPPPGAKEEVEEEPDEDFEGDFEESEDVPEIELQAALPLVSIAIEVGKPIESEKIPEIEIDLDTEEIIEEVTDIVNEAATESLDKKGNLSIQFEK